MFLLSIGANIRELKSGTKLSSSPQNKP